MSHIHFITTNTAKVKTLQAHLPGIDVIAYPLPGVIEPQSTSVKEVSISKAQQAFSILQKPVIVEDSGFYIHALGEFPGPYTKHMLETIGIEGMLKLLEDKTDRSGHFESCMTYHDSEGMKSFTASETIYEITRQIDRTENPVRHWSELHRIIIPEGYNRTLSSFTEEDFTIWDAKRAGHSTPSLFAEWFMKEKRLTSII